MTAPHGGAAFTYAAVGATAESGAPPTGFRSLERSAVIGRGEAVFSRAREAILRWEVQSRSGMHVAGAGSARVAAGAEVRLGIPFGPFRVHAPARVVYVLDEPRRAGFAYGTLPGHPERGEELFQVEHTADGTVRMSVRAIWRPAGAWWLVYPVLRLTQEFYTRRYLRVLA